MSDIYGKQDLRVEKTRKALINAMFSMLSKRSFDKITVNDLCEEAIVSRATFYSHFEDKYHLLKFSLEKLKNSFWSCEEKYTEQEIIANASEYIYSNKKLLKNLVDESNTELMSILLDFLTKELSENFFTEESQHSFDLILVNFCAGGIINLLLWQLKNNFPTKKHILNEHTYKILQTIKECNQTGDRSDIFMADADDIEQKVAFYNNRF